MHVIGTLDSYNLFNSVVSDILKEGLAGPLQAQPSFGMETIKILIPVLA